MTGVPLARQKARTTITIPEGLLQELDRKAREKGRTRSDMVCEAVAAYFEDEEEKLLAQGYMRMAGDVAEKPRQAGSCWPEGWPE